MNPDLRPVTILAKAGLEGVNGINRVVDSKAARKVDLGSDLVTVVETNATGISEGVAFVDFNRTLIKLH